jgi:hypothetical protein
LYQFVALFKNLDTFYFLDHLIVRKPSSQQLDGSEEPDLRWLGPNARLKLMANTSHHYQAERFESGGRTYYEMDQQPSKVCKVNSHVFTMLDWVQENYINHCENRPRRHPNPRGVKFSVLACEWDHGKLQTDKKRPATSKPCRKRPLPTNASVQDAMDALQLEDQNIYFETPTDIPVSFGNKSEFEFTFGMEV